LTVGSASKEAEAGEAEAKQTKRPRLTVGSSSDLTGSDKKRPRVALTVASSSSVSSAAEGRSKPTTTKVVVKKQPTSSDGKGRRVALTIASSSSASSAAEERSKTTTTKVAAKKQPTSSDGNTAAAALDPVSAVKAAQAYFAQNNPDEEMEAITIFENNDRECTLLYRKDPNIYGNTYLERFKFRPPSDKNDWQWTVKSKPYEDDAAMYHDDILPPEDDKLGELDEQTAVKAARRWYNEHFRLGGTRYKMDKIMSAYRNTGPDIEPNEPHEWSLRYTANGDPTEHFLRFKYRAELDRNTGGWKWTAYGYSETERPSESIGNNAEGYQDEQLSSTDDAPKKRSASSKPREAVGDSHGGGGRGPKPTKRTKPQKKTVEAVTNDEQRAATSDCDSDHAKTPANPSTNGAPKRLVVQHRLPYVMPSAECEDEVYRDIGGPKVRLLFTFVPQPVYYPEATVLLCFTLLLTTRSLQEYYSCHGCSRSVLVYSLHGLRMAVSLVRSTSSFLILLLQQQHLAQY
jgi:hypothetical protein